MKNRIIISTEKLDKSSWGLIYQFIKRFYTNSEIDSEILALLKKPDSETQKPFAVLKVSDKALDSDVYSEYGNDLLPTTQLVADDTTFAILYQKQNASRDFSNIAPFYFLHREFQGKVTLGINLACFFPDESNITEEQIREQSNYTFPCREFLDIFKDTKPAHGKNIVYFINERYKDKKTGEIKSFPTTTIAAFRDEEKHDKFIARNISPLTIIDKGMFFLFI